MPRRLKVDPNRLSPKSLRSLGVPDYYVDEYFPCIGCGATFLFSAADQRQEYELRKRYIWAKPVRCRPCQKEWSSLNAEIRSFPDELKQPTRPSRLREMTEKLERFKTLNSGIVNTALCGRIRKLLATAKGE